MGSYTKRDIICALAVLIVVAIVAFCTMQPGLRTWGDENAACLNEGIAIAESRFDEQARINYETHPDALPSRARDGRLVYPWGYPLMLSVVYRLAGFDRTGYSSIIWYKVPLALSVALLGAVLVLFYRRRFSIYASVTLALLFCLQTSLLSAINQLYADLPFLLLSMATLWLMELFVERDAGGKGFIALGVAYGLAMFMTHETRLDGLAVCAAALAGHALALLRRRRSLNGRSIAMHLMPYALFAALALAAEHLWLAPATPNTDAITGANFSEGLAHWANAITGYFSGLFGISMPWFGYVAAGLCFIGLVGSILRDDLHLALLTVGTLVVLALTDTARELRCLFVALPLLMMFAYRGLSVLAALIGRGMDGDRRALLTRVAGVLALGLLFFTFSFRYSAISKSMAKRGNLSKRDVYSAQAVEMYNYIQQQLPEDAVICFAKPRMLYLNTGRVAFRAGTNDRGPLDADYYLQYRYSRFNTTPPAKSAFKSMELVQTTKAFALYRVKK